MLKKNLAISEDKSSRKDTVDWTKVIVGAGIGAVIGGAVGWGLWHACSKKEDSTEDDHGARNRDSASDLSSDWLSSGCCYESALSSAALDAAYAGVYTSPWLNDSVRKFHDHCARQPSDADVKQIYEQYKSEIEKALHHRDISLQLEYTGSSYEGVRVVRRPDDPDLEYDVMVVLEGGEYLSTASCSGRSGYFTLKKKPADWWSRSPAPWITKSCDENGYVVPNTLRSKFHGILQDIINEKDGMGSKLKLIYHGQAAVQLDVYKCCGYREKLFSVDLVPTFVVDGMRYVAKPPDRNFTVPPDRAFTVSNAWRRSWSIEERVLFDGMDRDNGCRKQVLRVLKVIRNKEAPLQPLTSYHLKTALFKVVFGNECKGDTPRMGDQGRWSHDKIGQRLLDVLERLQEDLSRHRMWHYFDPEVNILPAYSVSCIQNMHDRIRKLRSNESQLKSVLTVSE